MRDITDVEDAASDCSDDYVQNDPYKDNPYRGPFVGFISGINWYTDEILKRLN